MVTTLNTSAYHKLIRENIEWLMQQPRSLERDHIKLILDYHLSQTIDQLYPTTARPTDERAR